MNAVSNLTADPRREAWDRTLADYQAKGANANVGISPALSAAMAARRHASAAASAHDQVWSDAWSAVQEAIAAIPHVRTVNNYCDFNDDKRVTHTTEDAGMVALSRRILASTPDHIKGNTEDDFYATLQEHVDAADAREAEAVRIRERYNLPAITAENNRLNDACVEAMHAVLDAPAQSLTDIVAKIEFIEQEDWENDEQAYEALVTDVRRLAGKVAS